MIWLDSVLATPLMGIRFVPDWEKVFSYKENVIPSFVKRDEGITIKLNSEDSLSFALQTPKGWNYHINHNNLSVDFQYYFNQVRKPGELTSLASPEIMIYSEILQKMKVELETLWDAVHKGENQPINFIGILARCVIDKAKLPPGIEDLVKYLQKPWDLGFIKLKTNFTANLAESEESLSRCHHDLWYDNEKNGGEVSLSLDFQRIFKEPVKLGKKKVGSLIEETLQEAAEYFEKIGTGEVIHV